MVDILEICDFGLCVLDLVMVVKNGVLFLEEEVILSLKKCFLFIIYLLIFNFFEVYAFIGV